MLIRHQHQCNAGAALARATGERFPALARKTRGEEGGPTPHGARPNCTGHHHSNHWKLEHAGDIGLQLPGMALQFESVGEVAGKLEVWARCAQRHPGYRNALQLTVQGALVTGHDRDEVGVPVFPTAQTLALAAEVQTLHAGGRAVILAC